MPLHLIALQMSPCTPGHRAWAKETPRHLISADSPCDRGRRAERGHYLHSPVRVPGTKLLPAIVNGKRPDCTHLVGNHTSHVCQTSPGLLVFHLSHHNDLSLGSPRQLPLSNPRCTLEVTAANCGSVGTYWVGLLPFKKAQSG